jgi:hypothetical protein
MSAPLDEIPGLQTALDRERDLRDAAFLDLPAQICGVPVRRLTLRDLLTLCSMGVPAMHGRIADPAQAAQTLWFLSVDFDPSDRAARDAFIARVAGLPYLGLLVGIDTYLDEMLCDLPAASGSGAARVPTVSMIASVIDDIASEYGWDDEDILDKPVPRLAQYLRLIQRRHNPRAPLINRFSDRVRGDYLRGLAAAEPQPAPQPPPVAAP